MIRSMRVDKVPFILRPLIFLYGWSMALLFRIVIVTLRATCKIIIQKPLASDNAIYTFWHDQLLLYFMTFHKPWGRQVWMNHPLWYMKPVHLTLCKFMGVEKLALGSTGTSGTSALADVIGYLGKGYSTVITPDGPAGPAYRAKTGIFTMARESKRPIIAIQFKVSRFIRLPTWDRKIFPLPFSKIEITFSEPLFITEEMKKPEAVKFLEESMQIL